MNEETPLSVTGTPKAPDLPVDQAPPVSPPQSREKFMLKLIGTALGLYIWGVILGVSYAYQSYQNPEVGGAAFYALMMGAIYALPVLTIMVIIGLLVKTRHAQKILYWITAGLFTIAGIIAAYMVHALGDPNLE